MRLDFGDHIGFQAFVLFAAGLFFVVVAIAGAPFVFEHPKARSIVNLIGRDGARLICGLLGTFLTCLAWWLRLAFR